MLFLMYHTISFIMGNYLFVDRNMSVHSIILVLNIRRYRQCLALPYFDVNSILLSLYNYINYINVFSIYLQQNKN